MRTNFFDLKRFSTAAAFLLVGGAAIAPVMAQTPPTAPPAAPGETPSPAQAPSGTATPTPAAPTPPPNYGIQYNGLVDGYFQYQFSNPKGSAPLTGRTYDVRHLSPTIALAELNVLMNAKPGGLGFKATLIAGDVADINHQSFQVAKPGLEARYKNVQQLYGTYAFKGAGGGVDVGKFYTPFGYEVTESNGNYNYSRSDVYALLPFYHFGLRAYTPAIHGLTLTGYIISAMINTPDAGVQDDNKQPSYIGQLNYADPAGKYSAIETFGFGTEKPFGVTTKAVLSDTDFTYNMNAASLIGLNYFYGKSDPDGPDNNTTVNGYAVYYKQTLTPKTGYALRYSGFTSKTQGVSPDVKPYEITATYEVKAAANFLTRYEFRHDSVNIDNAFLGSDGTPTKKDQDTVTVSGVFTF